MTEIGEDEGSLVIRTAHDRGAVSTVRLDVGITGQGEEAVDGHGRRLRRLEDIDVAAVVVGFGRVARVEQGAAIEDERAGVVGDVASTDGRGLSDVGEGGDGQGAATDDGGSGVIVKAGEGLRAAAVLDEGDGAGGLIDQAIEGAGTVPVAEAEDRRGGVGVDDRAGASERTDEDARSGDGGIPVRNRGTRGVEVEGRALAEIDVGIGSEGRGRARQLDGALIDVSGTRVSVSAGDDEETVARLGERARATRHQRADGQRVSGRRPIRRHDDFRGGSPEGAAGDRRRAGAIIKEHTTGADGQEAAERQGLSTDELEGIDRLRSRDTEGGGGDIVSRGRETRGRQRGIRRESGRSGAADEPVGAAEGGPTADDTVGAGRTGREGEGPAGDRREIKGGARRAGAEGSEGQRRRTTGSSDGLNGTMTSRRREGSEGLGVRRARKAFVTQDTARGVTEGVDVEDDGGAVGEDVTVDAPFAQLEHAVGDGGGAGQRVVSGRGQHPGTDAHLLEAGGIGTAVVRDDRSDDIVGRVRAAEAEGLRGRAGSDGTGDRQRTGAVRDEHRDGVSPSPEEIEAGRKGRGRASVDQGAGTIVGTVITADADFRRSTEGAHTGDFQSALQDIESSPQVARRSLEGEVTGAFLLEAVRAGTGLEDATGDESVPVTVNAQQAARAVALPPEVGVERQETVTFVANTGFTGATAADEVVEAGERRAETVTAVEGDARVGAIRIQVAELEDAPDGGAGQAVVDEDPTVGVIADEDVLLGEAVEDVAADFERTPVDVDREATGVQAERSGGGDADGAVVDTDTGRQRVLVVLQPQRRAVDQADLEDAILRVVVIIDPARDDGVTATEEDQAVAGTEVHVAREGGDAGNGSETGLAPASSAEADGAGESIVADGDQHAGAVVGARAATRRADDAIEGDAAVDGVRRLHEERTPGETRITRLRHAGDGDRPDTAAQLGRSRHDERATLDEDAAIQRVRGVGQHQRAVTRLDEARSAGELRVDRHACAEVDAQRGRVDADRSGEREARTRQLVIIARRERDAGEDETADDDVFAESDFRARAREISDIVRRGREIRGRRSTRDRSAGTGVDPSGTSQIQPGAGAAGTGRSIIGVPEDVRGLGRLGRTDGEESRSDHQRGARKQGTRLRTFH